MLMMQSDIIIPICHALTIALDVPVARIKDVSVRLQQPALAAAGDWASGPHSFVADDQHYFACRYHGEPDAVLVLGPRRVDATDGSDEERDREALRLAARGLGRSIDADQQRIDLASQLEVAGRSVLAITSELAIDIVLNRIVDLAREVSGARYAALGVPGPSGDLASFLTSGMSPEEERRIGDRPRGRGLLGLLLKEPRTLRLKDLHGHPSSAGFPEHHPPMKSFLGVPIMAHGQVLGNLYLTEKRTGDEFNDEDARLVEVLARHAAVAIENARLYQQLEAHQQRLQLVLDQLPEAAILAERDPERVTLANKHASNLLGWQIKTPMPLDEFLHRNPRTHADDGLLPVESIPAVRSLRNGETVNRLELRIELPDGRNIAVLVNSSPILDLDGCIVGSVTMFQDITEIKDAEQLKDDFLSLVSHELRTPLTTIQGGALMLQRNWETLDSVSRQELLADVATESHRLGSLIENMVQLTNIRAGRMRMETEPVHVRRLIVGAVDAMQRVAPGRVITLDIEPELLAEADPERIDQVVRNLLHNAIKYSPGATPIDVTAKRHENMVVIDVRDYGPGIDTSDLPDLFDRFSRASSAIDSGVPGMGLGLYLSRHVVEAHGGSIWVEHPEDGGTRMLFTIPAIVDDDWLENDEYR